MAFVGDRSRHQLGDGGTTLATETRNGLPAQVGQFGQGQTEHARRVQHSGIGNGQALPGGVGEGSGQQLLAGPVAPRWDQVQASFVDEPRHAVEQADSLVANVVKRIAEQFSAEREKLENQWGKGDNVSTEDLRQALRRYRSFFDRLLSF